MSIDLLPCRFLFSPSAAGRGPSRRGITLLSAGASPLPTPSRSPVRRRRVRAAPPSVPTNQAAARTRTRTRPGGENGKPSRRQRRRRKEGDEGEGEERGGCVPSMEEASIRVGTLYQNGDPLGRKELGRCVVEWLRQGMQSMAAKFASAELHGDMADLDAAALAQEWGSADGRLGFVIQAQPYMSAIPMPKGLEALCLKACTHYPTLFDHFQRELRDVLQSCQNQGLISDWRSTQSWKLLKEMANSAQHREAVRRTAPPRPRAVHGSIGVSLNKVKLMQRRIEQYVTHMSDLLRIERDVELEFTQEELNATPMLDDDSEPPKPVEYLVSHVQSQQEQCDTICNLNVISSSTGLGGLHLVLFRIEGGHKLPPTTLSPGDMVCVRTCNSRGEGATSCMQGFVYNLGEDGCSITLALESRHGDPTFSRLFGKSVRIDRIQGLADALTYERNLEALMILQRNGLQKSNASIGVVATLFGDIKDVLKMEQCNLTDWDESITPDRRISESNAAVDNMVERLSSTGLNIVRVGNPARLSPSVASKSLAEIVNGRLEQFRKELERKRTDLRKDLSYCIEDDSLAAGIRQLLKQLGRDLEKKEKETIREVLSDAQVVLSTNTGAADPLIRRTCCFDLVIIEEAGQAIEPSCWIPILQGKRCILAGDHCQLAPVILSRKALDGGLGKSFLERATSLHNGLLTTKLTVQHRMNDSIASWASKEMYHGSLKSSHFVASQTLADSPIVKATWITRCPLLLLDTRMPYGALNTGCGEQIDLAGTGSFYNDGEADIVTQHVLNLVHCGVSPTAIAVQSPYIAQVQLLRERLEEYPRLSGVEVSTIDSFQGREADAVVISMVRSNPLGAVGFLGDSRRMNVAITRARRHVTVVCDTSTICHSTFLARLLRHIRRYGQVKHVAPGSLDGISGLGFSQPTLPSIS
uniref:Helicase ATP-binding domain-containing protein n=1 Tax=Leersia perrieri TaxID=77586 RepID=A0A0D9VJY9_9ORYZ